MIINEMRLRNARARARARGEGARARSTVLIKAALYLYRNELRRKFASN